MPLSATRVLNPNASGASYKPKQRSYRKMNLKEKVLAPHIPGAQMASPKRTRPQFSSARINLKMSQLDCRQLNRITIFIWSQSYILKVLIMHQKQIFFFR